MTWSSSDQSPARLGVDVERRLDDSPLVELDLRLRPTRHTHPLSSVAVLGEGGHRLRERAAVAGRHEQAGHTVVHDLAAPLMSVATIGRPMAAASIAARGKPSRRDARTNRSMAE